MIGTVRSIGLRTKPFKTYPLQGNFPGTSRRHWAKKILAVILQFSFQEAMNVQRRSGRQPQSIGISSSPVSRRRVADHASLCITPLRLNKKSTGSAAGHTSNSEKKCIGSRMSFAAHQDLFPNLDDAGYPVGETISFERLQHDFINVSPMKYSRCENCKTQFIPAAQHGNSDFCSGECRWSWTSRVEESMHKFSSSSTVSFDCDDQSLIADSDDDE